MKNLLFVSNLFPNPVDPNIASFNLQQILALSSNFNIDVVAPVAWQSKLRKRPFPSYSTFGSVKTFHPTYFYTPGILRNLYGHFFEKSIRSCVACLLQKKNYQAVYSSWLYPDGWASAKLANRLGLPLFLKVHGTDVNQLKPGTAVTKRSLWAASQAKVVFCVSQALKDRLVALGAAADNLHVVYNGVDTAIFHPVPQSEVRMTLGVPPEVQLILYVGNLKKNKGLRELAAAFKKIQDSGEHSGSHLVVIGKGPFGFGLRSDLEKYGVIGKVSFLGSLPLEKIAKWMNAADLLCLPSYMEGVPNVLLEAFACGTSVVATSVGGIPELSRNGRRLTLVPAGDANALANAIISSLSCRTDGFVESAVSSWNDNAEKLISHMAEYL